MTIRLHVIVTTTGKRSSLYEAVASVTAQTRRADSVVVVIDTEDTDCFAGVESRVDEEVEVVRVRAGNGSAARNEGVRHVLARHGVEAGGYIAYLDDDDWWEPERLERVAGMISESSVDFLTGSAIFHRRTGTTQVRPSGAMAKSAMLGFSELLRRRHFAQASSFIQTSTMIVSARAAETVPWNHSLSRHQDWTYFYDVCVENGYQWMHVEDPLVHVVQGSLGSLSRLGAWNKSLEWILSFPDVDDAARAEFIVWQVLKDALAARSKDGTIAAVRAMLRLRKFGSPIAWAVLAAQTFSFERLRLPHAARGRHAISKRIADRSQSDSEALAVHLRESLERGEQLSIVWFNHFSVQMVMGSPDVRREKFDIVEIDGTLLKKIIRSPRRTSADLTVPILLKRLNHTKIAIVGGSAVELPAKVDQIEFLGREGENTVALSYDGFDGLPSIANLAEQVSRHGVGLVLVGLGAPLQERYVAGLRREVEAPCLVMTVGGFLDQVTQSGYYPSWAYGLRLNWLVRLVREPARLWRRYSVDAARCVRRRRAIALYLKYALAIPPSSSGDE